jgi:hypothetical protein
MNASSAALALLLAGPLAAAAPAPTCSAQSTERAPLVVELYTSEGCSSCPPADRWLSKLRDRRDVLALGFHVNYWDRLGWPDRFASAEITQRQYDLNRALGSRNVYTPQVVADGRDWRSWPELPSAAGAAPAPRVQLHWQGDEVLAEVAAVARPGERLAGYWAVLEDRHESRVRAGENRGETLRHDHVVRLYQPVPAWDASAGGKARLTLNRGVPGFPRRVAFVVTEPRGLRPLQAVVVAARC